MPFKKNDLNINTKGRAPGVQNKHTGEIERLLINVFESNLNEILKHQDKLTLNERITLNRTLLQYILPTLKSETYSNNLDPSIFDTSNW